MTQVTLPMNMLMVGPTDTAFTGVASPCTRVGVVVTPVM